MTHDKSRCYQACLMHLQDATESTLFSACHSTGSLWSIDNVSIDEHLVI